MLRDWEHLPAYMKKDEVRPYYDNLRKKRVSLAVKRLFDITASISLLFILAPAFISISILIALDS